LSASPASVSIAPGASATSTITVAPQNGFNGSVSLNASGLPSGVTASFNPASPTGTSMLTLTASSTARAGSPNVTVNGTTGSPSNSTAIDLTVQAVGGVLPTGWTHADVGAVGTAGDASFGNGSFTIKTAGSQIYGSTDAMHFAYQPLSGDGGIVARLV